MKDIISKELLGEVFTGNQQEFKVRSFDAYTLYYSWLDETPFGEGDCNCKWVDFEINIYELAHKCKEWAIKKGYSISSRLSSNGEEAMTSVFDINNDLDFIPNASIHGGKEFDAIFYSCQWILDNKGSK